MESVILEEVSKLTRILGFRSKVSNECNTLGKGTSLSNMVNGNINGKAEIIAGNGFNFDHEYRVQEKTGYENDKGEIRNTLLRKGHDECTTHYSGKSR